VILCYDYVVRACNKLRNP